MFFKTLKDRMDYLRTLSDYKLTPNSYVMVMVDGRSFSKNVKNKYKKPFDNELIRMMNETAIYLCQNIQGAKLAFAQSDEISVVITDFDTPTTDSFFGYRLCKIQSIVASLATSKFNALETEHLIRHIPTYLMTVVVPPINDGRFYKEDVLEKLKNRKLLEFDCRAWNLPSYNDVFAWFLYRQIDCIRNSKEQTAQTYLSSKQLHSLSSDEQIALLLKEKGVDWNEYDDGKKFGRFIYKEDEVSHCEYTKSEISRSVWKVHDAFPLTDNGAKEKFNKLTNIPKIN